MQSDEVATPAPEKNTAPAAPAAPKPRRARRSRENGSLALGVLGCALLAVWFYAWMQAFEVDRLAYARTFWWESWNFMFLDLWHNVLGARHWLSGGNPYTELFGDPRGTYSYPPLTLPLFAWVGLVEDVEAGYIWWTFSVAATVFATWIASRTRGRMGLPSIPLPLMAALVLASNYMLFQLERGQADVLCLLMIVLACVAMASRRAGGDVIAGVLLVASAWVKAYPGLVILGLLALRRPRAFLSAIVAGVVMGLAPLPATIQWLKNATRESGKLPDDITRYAHSMSRHWGSLFGEGLEPVMSQIPGLLGASLILLPIMLWVSYHVYRASADAKMKLAVPYLLWLGALATFWTPVSMDYNLIYLPLALLAVWSPRDSVAVHLLLLAFLVTWQPFRLDSISPEALFWMKFAGLLAAMLSLVEKAKAAAMISAPDAPPPGEQMSVSPATA